jgi:hypothetical protein
MALRQNFSVSSGMSEKSMALSGRAASFAKRRLRAAVIELVESFFRTILVITLALQNQAFCAWRRKKVGTSKSSEGTSPLTSRTFCCTW